MLPAAFLVLLSVFSILHLAPAPIIGPPGQIPPPDKAIIREKCAKIEGKCKQQPRSVAEQRKELKNQIVKKTGRMGPEVEEAFQKTFLAKKALYKSYGLGDIVPADNGLWAQMLLLNAKQAQSLIEFYSSSNKSVTLPKAAALRKAGRPNKRSAGLRFDVTPVSKWDIMPIPVYIDPLFMPQVVDAIRQALKTVSDSTCLMFDETSKPPVETAFMNFTTLDISNGLGCGAVVEVGRQGNGGTIVSIAQHTPSCEGSYLHRTILHEILHALGFAHEHQRYDRDEYIQVAISEADPLFLDNFAKLSPAYFTTYGMKYDYMSVLHYYVKSDWFSLVPGKGGEEHINEIGRKTELSQLDIQGVNRAYCQPKDCQDKHHDCPWWAVLPYNSTLPTKFCDHTDPSMVVTAEYYCPFTCGLCG